MNITLFPKLESVFWDVTDNHRAVFFPLLTIDLASIDKGTGKVHFVSYFRDGEPDLITDQNISYNFVRFKIENDKYHFDGDFNKIYLFEKSIVWYREAEQIYKEHKSKYLNNSEFIRHEDNRRMEIDFEYYYYIKGVLNYWVTRDKYLETGKFIQGGAYTYGESNHERDIYENLTQYEENDEILVETLTELGIKLKDLDFIGSVAAYNYLEFGSDELSIFISKDNDVFQYHNWS